MNTELFVINIVLLVVNIIMVMAAIRAIHIAGYSLKETQKTRKDNFLPMIIPRGIGWNGKQVDSNGNIRVENIGRGPAWNINIEYPSGEKKQITKFLHHEKHNSTDAVLPWPDFSKVKDEFKLTLLYSDMYNQLLRVKFKVTKDKLPSGEYILKYNQQDGFEFSLPD